MKVVRKIRDAEESRQRVWAAAATAFATRGFDGAKVDEIAKDAGINKAMVYYHFADKLTLYRAILQDMFSAVALATTDVRTTGGAPEQQLRGYVNALIRAAEERPHFPAIWLREIAEEGRHLDEGIFAAIRSVLTNLTGILTDGVTAGVWRRVDPFLVQAGVAAPVMLVLATQGVRQRAGIGTAGGTLAALVDHVTTMTLATLTLDGRSPS
jgi:TetR/AcrR family transcriptional regulator